MAKLPIVAAAAGVGRPANMRVIIVGVRFDVEPGQAQRRAADEDSRDAPNRLVVQVGKLRTHFHEQDRRREAERNKVAQAIELRAEIAGAAREPGDLAIDGVEQHGEQDQAPRTTSGCASDRRCR